MHNFHACFVQAAVVLAGVIHFLKIIPGFTLLTGTADQLFTKLAGRNWRESLVEQAVRCSSMKDSCGRNALRAFVCVPCEGIVSFVSSLLLCAVHFQKISFKVLWMRQLVQCTHIDYKKNGICSSRFEIYQQSSVNSN